MATSTTGRNAQAAADMPAEQIPAADAPAMPACATEEPPSDNRKRGIAVQGAASTVPSPAATPCASPAPTAIPPHAPSRAARVLAALELPLLLAVPVAMFAALATGVASAAGFMLAVVALVIALFFAGYEASRPALRQIMPTLVLAALAAAGRIIFGPIPDFKPVSAIAIIAGATLGPKNGFMVGALAALTSNFFFGQGMWTPWQMYAWGLVGYLGGLLAAAGLFGARTPDEPPRRGGLLAYGLASGLIYGAIINAYDVIGFVKPFTWPGAFARVAAAVPFDVTHSLATCVFLLALFGPWTRRINRVVRKFALRG